MQLLLIAFRSSLEGDVLDLVRREGFASFTMVRDVVGSGETGKAMAAFPWPASNDLLLIALESADAARLVRRLSAFRDVATDRQHGTPIPLRVFSIPCTEMS
ncbi:MAG TPA: hypothetical protein VFD92_04200 [Candidatus Binatia bacterium]|nr:hypothetical protein [Candidatus Binatia bacterium]